MGGCRRRLCVARRSQPANDSSVGLDGKTPLFEYKREANVTAKKPNFIYVDEEPLVIKLKAEAPPATYAKLFGVDEKGKDIPPEHDGTEGELSALTKAMFTEWLLHVAATELKTPAPGGAKVVPVVQAGAPVGAGMER